MVSRGEQVSPSRRRSVRSEPEDGQPPGRGTGWEDRAEAWIGWARTPDFDSYWQFRDAFFEEVMPPPGGATLEVGCGEGRVARDLRDRGHKVTAIDASPSLIAAASAADPLSTYVVARAEDLPFADSTFDCTVAYNSLMDVDDMPAALLELARVLVPGGRLAVSVTHPFNDAGSFSGMEEEAPFVITGTYFGRREFHFHASRDGREMDFDGFACDLESYSRALEAAGLLLELIREPRPASGARHQCRIPNFLTWRALKPIV